MKHWKNIVLPLLLVPVLVTGCIMDDNDDCDNVAIYFQYFADGDENVLSQYIDRVDLYVFDEGGHFIDMRPYSREQLGSYQAIPSFKLIPGKRYKVVAVGNADDKTLITGLDNADFSRMYIQSPEWGNADVVTNHDHNYLGQQEFVMPSGNFVVYRDTVTMYSSHINTHIEVTGLPAPGAAAITPVTVSIENSNGQISFENEINLDAKGTCAPELEYDAASGKYQTNDLTLYRMDSKGTLLEDYCNHQIVLKDATGKEMVRFSLHDFIKQNEEYIDVTKQEAYLPIEIMFIETGITIKLPAWYVEDINPDWQ